MPTSVPYGKLVGRRIREARAAVNLSQADLAERMRECGFRGWLSQTVSSTERAARRVTAEELLGLMVACETDFTALVYPAAEFEAVSLPVGVEVVLPAAKYAYNPDRHSVWDGNKLLLRPRGGGGNA
jgi:transcriptional regulator with XRE-family HTH domain